MEQYLLLETEYHIVLEDLSGFLILEQLAFELLPIVPFGSARRVSPYRSTQIASDYLAKSVGPHRDAEQIYNYTAKPVGPKRDAEG